MKLLWWKDVPRERRIEVLREELKARWNAAQHADRVAGQEMARYRAKREELEREVCKGFEELKGRKR